MIKMPEDNVINAIFKQLETDLNAEADKIIDQRAEEFRKELLCKKSVVVAGLLNSIKVSGQRDPYSTAMNFNIFVRSGEEI